MATIRIENGERLKTAVRKNNANKISRKKLIIGVSLLASTLGGCAVWGVMTWMV